MAISLTFCLTMLFISSTSFAQQCLDNGGWTVTDNGTGLMWQKETAGMGTWDDAMRYVSELPLGGHSGWRLPSIDELANLNNRPCKSLMELVPSYYWSSTTYASYRLNAWIVDFGSGLVSHFNKFNTYYARAVRPAQ